MKKRMQLCLLYILMLLLLPQKAYAGTLEITQSLPESTHDYANNAWQNWWVSYPGVSSISLTFDSRTKFESTRDFLTIYDADGTQVGKYSGTSLAGQTITVDSDAVRLHLTSNGSMTYWGFKVTKAWAEVDGCVLNVSDGWGGSISLDPRKDS